jgi:multidrug efflux pump subunit AcrA (membrane-fusion protein)
MRLAIGIISALTVACGAATAQHQPYAGMDGRTIKTLSEQQIADLNAGRGMGLALAAELNGYPGPMHAIELAAQLGLSADQVTKLKGLFESMKAETIPIGAALISQERTLNEDFAKKTVTPASLEAITQQIGITQAMLRAAHLKYHLATAEILSSEQVKRYNVLRGYTGNDSQHHHHRMHHR